MPIAPLIGLAGSIGGALLNRGGSSQSGTSTSTQSNTYTDGQKAMQGNVQKLIKQLLKGKETKLDRQQKTAMGEDVNNQYIGTGARLDSMLTQRGFGESGKHNMNTMGLELARNQDFMRGNLELDKAKSARQMQALGIGAQVGFNPTGSTTTGSTTGTASGQSVGQSLAPVVAGAGQDLAAWLHSRKD